MRDVRTWSDETYLNPRSPTLLIQHDRVCSIHMFCCIHSYWFAHLTSLATMLRNAWLVARGSKAILPWVHSMIGRVVVHTFGLYIPCHALSVLCCSKTSVLQEEMAGRQLSVPADYQKYPAGDPIFGRWPFLHDRWCFILAGGIPKCSGSGSEATLGFSQFSEVQNSANRGMAMGFRARWIEHASSNHLEAELRRPL